MAIAALAFTGSFHCRDDCGPPALLIAKVFRVLLILGQARIALLTAIQSVNEADVIETPDVMQIPQLHRIDLACIRIEALGLFIDVRDGSHGRIELPLQKRCQIPVDIGCLRVVEPAFVSYRSRMISMLLSGCVLKK